MSKKITHIIQKIVLPMCFYISITSYAQLRADLNEVTTLSVNELTGVNHVWEIYKQPLSDFATASGNITSNDAIFVNGNTGSSVDIKWLKSGTYFYKVTSENSCTDNLKIGKVIVKPERPSINVFYDCENNSAVLTARDYNGTLKWNTGETSEEIKVDQAGTYTLTQTINGVESHSVEVFITNPKNVGNPDISDTPTTVYLDDEVTLSATGCNRGEIHWYTDKQLKNEVTERTFNVQESSIYYAVCVTDAGCESETSTLTLIVEYKGDDCEELFANLEGKITNAISPNSNGQNDVWTLENLKDYCEKCHKTATIEIFNRWGNMVYKQNNYFASSNKFSGQTHNSRAVFDENEKLPDGTYFYVIKIEGDKTLTGWIYVGR